MTLSGETLLLIGLPRNSATVLEWRSTVRAVLFSILTALRYWRAGVLSVYPARVFLFRGARMASKGFRPRP